MSSVAAKRAGLLAACVAGAIGGAVVSHTLSGAAKSSAPAAEHAAPRPSDSALRDELAQMQARLRVLEHTQTKAAAQQAAPATMVLPAAEQGAHANEPSMDPAEVERAAREMADTMTRELEQEVVDAAWARTTERAFSDDLRALADKGSGFEIESFECRSSRCRGVLRFASHERAQQAHTGLLTRDYQNNCERTVYSPFPGADAHEGDPYRSTVFFDCTNPGE